jgi:hypothetical protein
MHCCLTNVAVVVHAGELTVTLPKLEIKEEQPQVIQVQEGS